MTRGLYAGKILAPNLTSQITVSEFEENLWVGSLHEQQP